MPKKYVHPEGGEAFPVTPEDEKVLKEHGWQPEKEEKPGPPQKGKAQ